MQGDSVKEKEQVFPFWDVKKRRGDIMRYISGFSGPGALLVFMLDS